MAISAAFEALVGQCDVIDLSHRLEEGVPSHPAHSRYFHELWESYWHGDRAVTYQIIMNEHSGTHVDAPAHFIRDGQPKHVWVDELPPAQLLGRGACIDVRSTAPFAAYDVDVLQRFEREHGTIQPDDVVLFCTGWSTKWAPRPDGNAYLEGWPGPTRRLCECLVDRGVRAVGCDNLGFDCDGTEDFPGHYTLLGAGVPIVENLNELDKLPPFSLFIAIPLKIAGGSGSPVRALGFVRR
jgi:kynurenine formamidase